jgi:aminoglycoside phosphotransferase (APT) family kinase protein
MSTADTNSRMAFVHHRLHSLLTGIQSGSLSPEALHKHSQLVRQWANRLWATPKALVWGQRLSRLVEALAAVQAARQEHPADNDLAAFALTDQVLGQLLGRATPLIEVSETLAQLGQLHWPPSRQEGWERVQRELADLLEWVQWERTGLTHPTQALQHVSPMIKSQQWHLKKDPLLETGLGGANLLKLEDAQHQQQAVCKIGSRQWLERELAGLAAWERQWPGSVPKVLSVEVGEAHGVCVMEFLDTPLLEAAFTTTGHHEAALGAVTRFLGDLWQRSLQPTPAGPEIVPALCARLHDVHAQHPQFQPMREHPFSWGTLSLTDLHTLLAQAEKLESENRCPVQVWTHGDFNLNNLFWQPGQALRFIDVHRSHPGDYVIDLATLAVSIGRHPHIARALANWAEATLADAGYLFAAQIGDTGFATRWELALGRYYITASRLFWQVSQAERLYLTGIRHLETAVQRIALAS